MVYTVEAFINEARKGDMVLVEGYVKQYDTRPPYPKGGHTYRNVTLTSEIDNHGLEELTVTLIDNECTKIEKRSGEFITFSGRVNQYGDKPKKLSGAKIVNDTNKVEQMKQNNKANNENDEEKARRRVAPVVGMLYNNFFEAKAKAFDYDPNGTTIESVHNETIKEITRQRIQDVLDLTDKFLHPKSEAEEVFDDPFEGE